MRKTFRLQVTLWIEGEDEPAHEFVQSTSQAVRDAFRAGIRAHPELRLTVKHSAEASES